MRISQRMRYRILASDYDGTIATHGVVATPTQAALRRYREAGGILILVTGRELEDLQNIFENLAIFHWIVAENGAVLFETATSEQIQLTPAPPQILIDGLRERGVQPLYVGRVIVASGIEQAETMEEIIASLQLPFQVIPNKEAAMILPLYCDKATGMAALFTRMGWEFEAAAGVGDGENDLPLLQVCGLGVAVSNALPVLKNRADWVMSRPAGDGVIDLIDRLLEA